MMLNWEYNGRAWILEYKRFRISVELKKVDINGNVTTLPEQVHHSYYLINIEHTAGILGGYRANSLGEAQEKGVNRIKEIAKDFEDFVRFLESKKN